MIVIGLITFCWVGLRNLIRSDDDSESIRVDRALLAVLVASGLIYLVLQLRVSLPLWNSVWQLKVLGYPFRMMAYLVPLLLVMAVMVADWYWRAFRPRFPVGTAWVSAVLAAGWVASLVVLSPITAHAPPPTSGLLRFLPFYPISVLKLQPSATFETSSFFRLFPEYLPVVDAPDGRGSVNASSVYQHLHQSASEAASLSSVPCSIREVSGSSFESLKIVYRVSCAGPTEVALPISYNPFTSLGATSSSGVVHPIRALHVPTDPRIVIRVRRGGVQLIVARLPTLLGILS